MHTYEYTVQTENHASNEWASSTSTFLNPEQTSFTSSTYRLVPV